MSGDRRARRREARMDAICEAALDIIASDGLEGLTTQKLADAVDLAPAALYRYFDGREALLAALKLRVIAAWDADRTRVLRAAMEADDPRLIPVAVVARHYVGWFAARPGRLGLIAAALADPRPLLPEAHGREVMAAVMPLLADVSRLLRGAGANGRPDSAGTSPEQERTLVFWCAVQGVLQSAKLARFAPEHLDVRRLLRATLHALLSAWGHPQDRLAQDLEHTLAWTDRHLDQELR